MTAPALVTALYVPGDRPERFDKAVATGADLVILDLEDAVPLANKDFARSAVVDWLSKPRDAGSPVIEVRVNAGNSDDLTALRRLSASFGLRVPKVAAPGDLDLVEADQRPVTALIETALGVENAALIAAHPAVHRLALGESDLASDLGIRSPALLDYGRVRMLYAARAAHLPAPMMSPYPDIRDVDGLRADTERGRELGWVGRTAIHPSQLAVIIDVFRPSDADVEWARQVITATESGGVATLPSGEMVDPAMVGRARAVLARIPEDREPRQRKP